MDSTARVVVIGGGVAGCSVAYHLAALGWTDCVLVEKGELTSGTTWHAAGLCTQFNASFNLSHLLMGSVALFRRLEQETGLDVGFHQTGSLRLAATPDRMDEYRHARGRARALGLDFELVGPREIEDLCPLVSADGLLGAAYLPTDGHVDPYGLTQALAAGARSRGARVRTRTRVTAIERAGDGWRVVTDRGTIACEVVVNAAGMWAPEVARMVGTTLPIVPLEHQYLVTEPLPELAALQREIPVVRDTEESYYVRAEVDALLVGPFESDAALWAVDGIPEPFEGRLLPPALDRLEPNLAAAAARFPAFADAGIRRVVNGPDGYTPDGRCLMGEMPGLRGFYVLAGFSILGIVFGGQAGRYLAEWIVDGQPSDNMWDADVRRFGPWASEPAYLTAKAREAYEREYAIHYPEEERPAGRPVRTDPLHERLRARGAVFGFRAGWERPLWFAPQGVEPVDELTFRVPNWHEHVGAECRAVRERVGVLDQTSFAKYEVSGPGAAAFLDHRCANRLPGGDGRIVVTQMLTPRGGIECDLTVTQLAPDRYYVVSAASTETHDLAWIARHVPDDGSVRLDNVTCRYGVLTVAGPRSRELLQGLSDDDFGAGAFRFLRAREVTVGGVRARAMRLSYVGELGWELHHDPADQVRLYDALRAAGDDLGLVDFGYRALESMRLEKGYRLWGADVSADYSPLEAGLEMFVKLDKGDFVGRLALLRQQAEGVERKLCTVTIATDGVLVHGDEPVSTPGGEVVSYLMAGGYGHVVGALIGLTYLPPALAEVGTRLEVEVLGERCPATVAPAQLYDPANERLRG